MNLVQIILRIVVGILLRWSVTTISVCYGWSTPSKGSSRRWYHHSRAPLPRQSCTLLFMGGYYQEPDDAVVSTNTHMVFGIRCVERTIALSESTSITLLQPAVSAEEEEEEYDPSQQEMSFETYLLYREEHVWRREVALASYLLQYWDQLGAPTRVTVLEDGPHRSGLVSLALASQGTTVQVCAMSDSRLKLIQSSHLFYGTSSWGRLETGTYRGGDCLSIICGKR